MYPLTLKWSLRAFSLNKIFFTIIVFMCSIASTMAQFRITLTTSPSTCSSNGTITATPSGATGVVVYEIISGPAGFTRPSQTNNVFISIPPGLYQVQGTDGIGQSDVKSVTVAGNYSPPTIQSCNVNGSTATITVRDGLAPFNYAISSDGGGTFSPPQNANVFTCLNAGDYVFRVSDACNNFFPCQNSVTVLPPRANISCTPVSPGVTNIRAGGASQGEPPYTYTLVNNTGVTLTNSNGIFNGVAGCSFTLTISDKCGKKTDYPNITCTQTDVSLGISCVNFNARTATVVASGGVPPYVYEENRTGVVNNTGIFSGLANVAGVADYRFIVRDACANSKQISIRRPTYVISASGCPYDSIITAAPATLEILNSDTCPTNRCPYFFYPITFTCPTCPNTTAVVNKPSRFSPLNAGDAVFTGVNPGNYTITSTDACGNTSSTLFRNTIQPSNIEIQTANFCVNRSVRVRRAGGAALSPGTIVILKNASGVNIDTSTNGNFTLNKAGNYSVEVQAPRCAITRQNFTVEYNLTPDIYCDSIGFTPCPNIPGYTYQLFDLSTNTLVNTRTINGFGNLVSGRNYRIIAINPILLDSIVFNFRSGELPPQFIADSLTCSSFLITPIPPDFIWKDRNNIPARFIVFDAGGNEIRNQTNGSISGLSSGNYTFTVTHPVCGTRQNTVSLSGTPNPSFCIDPSDSYNAAIGDSATCSFGWNVAYNSGTSQIRVRGGPNNINKLFNGNGLYQLNNLLPGSYTIETECGNQSLELPPSPLKLTATALSSCPGLGRIDAGGALSAAQWATAINALGLSHCGQGLGIQYRLKSFGGNFLTRNSTGVFTNLEPGFTYKIEMLSPNSCRLDSIEITIPFYVRPQLTTTFGAVCGSPAVGSVQATVNGGFPPYKFEIISPSGFTPINTSNSTVQFNNLPIGNYVYRVSDSCGISAEFSSGVDVLNFTPRYRRFCDGGIQLEAPSIIGAAYTWRDGAGNIVGNTNDPIVPDSGADTYSINITFGSCTYNRTISVPDQTVGAVLADAGPDIVDTTFTTQLQGVNPGVPGVVTFWSQTFPSSGTTTFSNFTNATSGITVSQYPGEYTYVWSVDGGANGCVDYDTVKVTLVECPGGIKDITANLLLTPTSCTAADGKAKVVVTSSGQIFSYFWSNGQRSDSIGGLLPGSYNITVRDGDFCTRDFVRNFDVVPGITINFNNIQSICEGDSVSVAGKFYKNTGIYRDTLTSIFLCDSVITTNLTVYPIERVTVNISICNGDTLNFNGNLLTLPGTYLDTLQSIFGCDSIVTLNLVVYPNVVTNISATICSDETYSFDGQNLNVQGVYVDSLLTAFGCDSIVFLDLTVNPVQNTTLDIVICEGDSYDFNGTPETVQGVYVDTLLTYLNCDSIITLNLTVLPLSTAPLPISICEGESYVFNSVTYTVSGIYIDTLVNFLGCDSIVTLNLEVNPNKDTVLDITICNNQTFDFNGLILNTAGTYTDLLQTFKGCDSLVTLNLTVLDVLTNVIDASICEKETYLFNGVVYDSTGTYIDILTSSFNCDSIVTLNLLVKPITFFSFDIIICELDSFDFNGTKLTTSGVYIDTVNSSFNCDSIITLNLTVNPVKTTIIDTNICDGEVYDFIGQQISVAGTYTTILQTYLNCDSTVILNLTVNPVKVTDLNATICSNQTYDFNGRILNTTGLYTDVLTTYLGCDSIVNLNLLVNPIALTTLDTAICDGEQYNFNGRILTIQGTYIDTLRTFQDCDSIITLHLTVKPLSSFEFDVAICEGESYSFFGSNLNQTGVYVEKTLNYLNCDSTITLNLTVNPVKSTILNENICEDETFNFIGDVLNTSGTYSKVLSTYLNCDSVVTLNLTVFPIQRVTVAATICSNERFDFNGRLLNTAGTYIDTLRSFADCDSIVTLDLTVNPIQVRSISASICEGDTYNFLGNILSISGTYRDTLNTFQNCDSIIILNLEVRPKKFFSFSQAICEGDAYDFNGISLSTAGVYLDTVLSSINCDSIITLNLIVNPVKVTNLRDTICDRDVYNFIGDLLTFPGNYSKVLRTYLNCDSTVNLNLVVLPLSLTTVNAEICEGTRYDLNGVFYTQTGVYFDTLLNYLNCDSIITLNLNVLPRQRVSITGEICDNETYDFNGSVLNQQGRYIDTLPDVNGCDSIITLDLTVNPTYVVAVTDSFCTGDIYVFDGQNLTVGGVYDGVLSSISGCDSTVQLTLLQRNMPTVDLGRDTFICDNNPVIYNLPLEVGTSAIWQDGANTSIYPVTQRGVYSVVVENICGRDEDEVTVNAGCDGCDVYLPNAFTPNGDNINDRFVPQYGCDPIAVNDFWVADRWGNIIFRTNQLGDSWDGTWKGQPSPMDNYIWYIDITFVLNGEVRSKQDKGSVLIIR